MKFPSFINAWSALIEVKPVLSIVIALPVNLIGVKSKLS